ncbi:MAG: prepilin-type N-terminal cleavage/methylation domain-containing protein [Gemmataceae bacterium]
MKCILTWSSAVVFSLGLLGCAAHEKEVVAAEKARDHLNETCTIEMEVRSSKHEVDKQVFYLDSEADYKDKKNLAVVIAEADLHRFQERKIEDPSSYYRGKRLRVTGKVVFQDDQFQVHVTSPSQIEIVQTR